MKKWSEYLLLVEVNKNQCGKKKNDSLKWINRKKKNMELNQSQIDRKIKTWSSCVYQFVLSSVK